MCKKKSYTGVWIACEPQTYFRSSLLSLGGREATTGNTSAVRRLEYGKPKTGKIKGRCQPLLSQMLASVVDT